MRDERLPFAHAVAIIAALTIVGWVAVYIVVNGWRYLWRLAIS